MASGFVNESIKELFVRNVKDTDETNSILEFRLDLYSSFWGE